MSALDSWSGQLVPQLSEGVNNAVYHALEWVCFVRADAVASVLFLFCATCNLGTMLKEVLRLLALQCINLKNFQDFSNLTF